jgi:hypothetical protein
LENSHLPGANGVTQLAEVQLHCSWAFGKAGKFRYMYADIEWNYYTLAILSLQLHPPLFSFLFWRHSTSRVDSNPCTGSRNPGKLLDELAIGNDHPLLEHMHWVITT